MIYISAQPDEFYFLWQLELQLFNFQSLGIQPEQIHVLIGYNQERGLNHLFNTFIEKCKTACIYTYPDTRKQNKYPSSIRPHLLAKHFNKIPQLEYEEIFYHDSDILFYKYPEWDILLKDNCWYASDTRFYLDSNYIKRNMGENEFQKMCDILSIKPQLVKDNDLSAGGAQYILKNCNASFWSKIESDCEILFSYLYSRQKHQKKIHPKFQIWCTDMWVIWWNALLIGQPFKIHPLLDFCWVDSPVENLSSTIILHYTGSSKENVQIFDKTKYRLYSPFYDDLSKSLFKNI